MTEPHMISTWCGVPLTELPREKLEEIIAEQATMIRKLTEEITERSVKHIRTLADIARNR